MVCSPDISMSYNVITSKHHSERMAETGTLFKGQQWDNKSGWGGTEKCQTSDLMLLSKYKRRPDAWNKHVVLHLESEATSFFSDTAHPFRLISWLLELDSGTPGQVWVSLLWGRSLLLSPGSLCAQASTNRNRTVFILCSYLWYAGIFAYAFL